MEFPFDQAPQGAPGAPAEDLWGFTPAPAPGGESSLDDLLALYQAPTEGGESPFAPLGEPEAYPAFPDFATGGPAFGDGEAGFSGFGPPGDSPFPDFTSAGAPDFTAPPEGFGPLSTPPLDPGGGPDEDPFAMPGAPVFEAFEPAGEAPVAFAMPASDEDPFAMPGAPVFEALEPAGEAPAAFAMPAPDEDPFAMPAPGDDPFAMPGAPVFAALEPASSDLLGEGDAFPALPGGADPFDVPEDGPLFPPVDPAAAAAVAIGATALAVAGASEAPEEAELPAPDPQPVEPPAAVVEPDPVVEVPPVAAVATVPAAEPPAAVGFAADLEGVLKSAEERKKLHAEISGLVTTLNAQLDEVQTSLAGLYGDLQKAAVRRASVSDLTRLTEQIAEARQKVAVGSEPHKQALYMRQVADAYLALMGEL